MRAFFVAIVVVAIGYLGWVFFSQKPANPEPPVIAPGATTPAPSVRPGAPVSAARAPNPTAPAASPPLAPPGVFYAGERISMQTSTGVKALNPGEEVRLMYRYKDGTVRVTTGTYEFVVKPASLTKDRSQALLAAPH